MTKQTVLLALTVCWSACAPQNPPTGLPALQTETTWNQARKVYFHATETPSRQYEVDGVKGEIIDVHVYPTPRPDRVVVTFGETYYNTTGWEVHVVLMKTNDIPAYPGNLYVCPIDFNFAVDWFDAKTLGIFYREGSYPDKRDIKTGVISKRPHFQYEKRIAGITVKFISADRATLEAKQEAMRTRQLGR